MKITFETQNKQEVAEVLALIAPESKSEIATSSKEEKTIAKPTPKPKSAPTPKAEPKKEEKKSSISLADLKDSAKNAVARSSREDVKKAISEFADKLASVDEEQYGKLYKKLQELGT